MRNTMLKTSSFNVLKLSLEPINKIKIYPVVDDLDTIAHKSTLFNPNQITMAKGRVVIYPVLYALGKSKNISDNKMINLRALAVQSIFEAWNDAGFNTRNAKSPFSSKAFQKYLTEIDYLNADYIITNL